MYYIHIYITYNLTYWISTIYPDSLYIEYWYMHIILSK